MNYYLSLPTAKKLKEWGCEVPSYKFHEYDPVTFGGLYTIVSKKACFIDYKYWNAYDLRDIICDGDMAKAFFGEDIGYRSIAKYNAERLIFFLHNNKKEEAESYLLDNCIFNPKNR